MKFGAFSLTQIPDQTRRVDAIREEIEEFVLAESLGYDTVWVAEHLFSTYGVAASTQVVLAAAAQATSRIRLGTAVSIIPFNHPLRTASDFGLIDVLSEGRLNFGVGRAYQPHEFTGLGIPMEHSRAMFDEGMEIIVKSWRQETIDHHGEFWTIPESVEVLPKTVQAPTPPIYMAAISAESFSTAARNGWHVQLAAPFSYRIYRDAWKDELESLLADYEEECRAAGHDPASVERAILVPFFCAPTETEAVARYGRHVEWFYNKVSGHERPTGADADRIIPGYELQMVEGRKTKEQGLLNFQHLHAHGAAIASDPEGCVAALLDLRERFGLTEAILWFNIGGIPTEWVRESMQLTMEQVVPKLRS